MANAMSLPEFIAYHTPALEREEVKHGIILGTFARAREGQGEPMSYWTLGEPGSCAIQTGPHAIVLGALTKHQCRTLAELTVSTDYPGVVGPDPTAQWFTDWARRSGVGFLDPAQQQIYAIGESPKYPGASGHARPVTREDAALLVDWRLAFQREAVPRDPVPSRAALERPATEGGFLFWIDQGRPVSMAGIVRRLKHSAAITSVYTPPDLRGRGYAGSVTAAAVDHIRSEQRSIACLYADRGNPASNRCYVRIGFKPVCGSSHFYRRPRVSGGPASSGWQQPP